MEENHIKINYRDLDILKISIKDDKTFYNNEPFKVKTPTLYGKLSDNKIEIIEPNVKSLNYRLYKEKMSNIRRIINNTNEDLKYYYIDEKTEIFDENKTKITVKNLKEKFSFVAFVIIYSESVYLQKLMKV